MNNLESIYQVIPESFYQYSNWYHLAHEGCRNLATGHSITVESACGIVAALSPRLPWNLNLIEADKVLYGLPSRALGESINKANRIKSGESPDSVLGGNKVRSFYQNLLNPSDNYHVTVDIWASRAYYGNLSFNKGITARQYAIIADEYRRLAYQFGKIPSQVQAVIWEYVRHLAKSRASLGQLPIDL